MVVAIKCGYGGIGRRAGFRCQSGKLGAGSTPVIRTIKALEFSRAFIFLIKIKEYLKIESI